MKANDTKEERMIERPRIVECSKQHTEPIPGKRFFVARDVPFDSPDDFGRTFATQYLLSNGRWSELCWQYGAKVHGYFTKEEAEAMLKKENG